MVLEDGEVKTAVACQSPCELAPRDRLAGVEAQCRSPAALFRIQRALHPPVPSKHRARDGATPDRGTEARVQRGWKEIGGRSRLRIHLG